MAPAAAAEAPVGAGLYQVVPIGHVAESKTNPRTHFDEAYIAELGGSIKEKGLIQPIIVRDRKGSGINGTFEIIAGACRYRGSKLVGLTHIPVIVREMTDDQVLEAQLEENIHRKDLTDLEESDGYHRLIASNPTKHSAETIATRIGKSVGYVWDRLKLKALIPEARAILEQGLMSVGHAILISRLKAEDQKRAIAAADVHNEFRQRDGLWRTDNGFTFDEDDPANKGKKPGKYDGLKPCSVRELEKWIQHHVRFDVTHAAAAQPFEFEAVAAKVETAAAKPGRGRKVIAITHEYRVADDARAEDERTYGSQSWERADGLDKSKTCNHSVLGVVAAGEGYGSTLEVCVARDKCLVHFGTVIRKKEKTAKLRESGQTAKADKKEQAWEVQQRKEREKRDRLDARWKLFYPALRKAVAAARGKIKAVNGPIYDRVLKAHSLPAGTKPANLPMVLLDEALAGAFTNHTWYGSEDRVVGWAKLLGVDVKVCEPETPKAAKAEASAKPAKKKAAKKR